MLVSPVVRNKALAAGAARWLDELPGLIAGLERDWGITVGPPYPDATEAFVAEAGPASVLKLMIPRDGDHASNEITVLRLAGGDGCVRLQRADEERGARRPGPNSTVPARSARSSTRWPARPAASRPTTTSGPSCCTATSTSGMCSRRPVISSPVISRMAASS